MKAIISHDIDHITVTEHLFRDLIVPKYFCRMHLEVLSGKITVREYVLRWSELFKNKWQNIDELITFNNQYDVPSSFFIAVNKGVGLNYGNAAAMSWISQMRARNCEIGIHGIEFANPELLKKEFELFARMSGSEAFGIRMHYVRNTKETFSLLAKCGYKFDSTEHAFKDPYKIGSMWEFPFQIMDGWIIEGGKGWQSVNLNKAKEETLRIIDRAEKNNLKYLGIDFHDHYFSHSYETWLNWYIWLVDYLKLNGVSFVNFNNAITELEAYENLER